MEDLQDAVSTGKDDIDVMVEKVDDGAASAAAIDTNGDGKADAWDTTGDGKANAFDTNGDGKADAFDTTGDGIVDSVMVNGVKKALSKKVHVDMWQSLIFFYLDTKSATIVFGNICLAVVFAFTWLLKHNGMGPVLVGFEDV